MGFFDDLDADVRLPGDDPDAVRSDVDPVVEALRGGWSHVVQRRQPGQERQRDAQYQEVELGFDGQRFVWTERLLQGVARGRRTVLHEERSTYDTLRDRLTDHPWVARAALDALGVDGSQPEF